MDLRSRTAKEALRRLVPIYAERLSDEHGEILRARYVAGDSMRKIAEARGMSRSNAHRRLQNAVSALLSLVPASDPSRRAIEAPARAESARAPHETSGD